MTHLLLVAWLTAQATDAATTCQALRRPGVYEASPVMPSSCAGIVGVKSGLAAVGATSVLLSKGHHPKLLRGIMLAGTGYSAYLTYRNMQNARER